MKASDMVRIAKDYYVESHKMVLTAWLVSMVPFLATPPWSKALDIILEKILRKVADLLDKIAYFAYTDLRVTAQGKRYVNAKMNGYAIELNGTPEEKKRAEDEIKEAFKDFAKFNR